MTNGYQERPRNVCRLMADGTLDTSFDQDGRVTLSTSMLVEINDLLVQPDGRIVVGGLSVAFPLINYHLMTGRLNADGTMDTGFGVNGWRQVDTDATEWADERVLALARQADGKIIAAGYTQVGGLTLARLSGMTRHYAMQDANWNLTGIVDPNTGQAVERYVFVPYGGRTILAGDFSGRSLSSFAWIVGHQGLVVDVETGLVYNRARYLDTSMGRFTIRDPLGYVDGMSLYEYVAGDPIAFVDPKGTAIAGDSLETRDEIIAAFKQLCPCFEYIPYGNDPRSRIVTIKVWGQDNLPYDPNDSKAKDKFCKCYDASSAAKSQLNSLSDEWLVADKIGSGKTREDTKDEIVRDIESIKGYRGRETGCNLVYSMIASDQEVVVSRRTGYSKLGANGILWGTTPAEGGTSAISLGHEMAHIVTRRLDQDSEYDSIVPIENRLRWEHGVKLRRVYVKGHPIGRGGNPIIKELDVVRPKRRLPIDRNDPTTRPVQK